MRCHRDFVRTCGRVALLDTAAPWVALAIVPLAEAPDAIAMDADYATLTPVLDPITLGDWAVVDYAAAVYEDEVLITPEVLPYAYLEGDAPSWTHTGEEPVIVRTIAVIGQRAVDGPWELLFWDGPDPVVPLLTGDVLEAPATLAVKELADA